MRKVSETIQTMQTQNEIAHDSASSKNKIQPERASVPGKQSPGAYNALLGDKVTWPFCYIKFTPWSR